MPQLLLNDVQGRPFVRQFIGVRVPEPLGMAVTRMTFPSAVLAPDALKVSVTSLIHFSFSEP